MRRQKEYFIEKVLQDENIRKYLSWTRKNPVKFIVMMKTFALKQQKLFLNHLQDDANEIENAGVDKKNRY